MKSLLSCEVMTKDMGFQLSTKKGAFNEELESWERLLSKKGEKKLMKGLLIEAGLEL